MDKLNLKDKINVIQVNPVIRDINEFYLKLEETNNIKEFVNDCVELEKFYGQLSPIQAVHLYRTYEMAIKTHEWRLNEDQKKEYGQKIVEIVKPALDKALINSFDYGLLEGKSKYLH